MVIGGASHAKPKDDGVDCGAPLSEVQRGQKFLDQLPVAPHGAALSYLR